MNKYTLKVLGVLCGLVLGSCSTVQKAVVEPVDYVNPYMGNISHLLVPTYPTMHLPNGMLRVYPERDDYTGVRLRGLPVAVTSHRGSSAFSLSPYQGPASGLQSVIRYSYDREKITPYSYYVYLDEQEMDVHYGLSSQAALYEINFGRQEDTYLVVSSRQGQLDWDGKALSGYQELANNTRIYVYIEPETQPTEVSVLHEGKLSAGTSATGREASLVIEYPASQQSVRLRYGISFIDAAQARQNMLREVAGKSIADLQTVARKQWNEALGKINIAGGSPDERTVFYTSLYRTFERPVNITEDGRYFSAFDGKVHKADRNFYTDDWIWDSYRAHHPLNVLIDPAKEEDILNSFVLMAQQMDEFWLPTFPEITGDSRRMNSNHGVPTLLDAWRKGLRNFDLKAGYEAAKNAITEKTLAPWSAAPAGELDRFYKEKGYIPALRPGEKEYIPEVHSFERRQAIAVTLGTAYDQWALAGIADELGYREDAKFFQEKSYNYRHLFNPKTGFFHPKDSTGNFIEPFDYKFAGGMGARDYYGENNAWTYQWDVQHNVADLISLMGGREAFLKNLDQLFEEPLGRSKFDFYAQLPDQTGNVGQFSMANEPSLHIPYLYNYAGQPWKTQKMIRFLVDTWFRNDLMGVPGDEDGGGMSAFVVFSQLGFYPVTPGMPVYNIGSPVFEKAVLDLGNGKHFTIIAKNYDPAHKYIQSARLNGKEWNKAWFSHEDISNGGELELTMGLKPNKNWGTAVEAAPPSLQK
ncbi:GH92 family glycosyl hydrolase [Pontibacter sp. BT731]|uniref:GH92 family glycosyl hydrolase n=1 Tax=Pontibacter coccineus TaxID=3063328 RepID=UPI0026E404D8|nr:GH92 family glycosyl hydrolase [Pontibacter sp. BT731]MDO6390114.1 GH92 family glycosyl hydrolase [Pontibacter sp. BT731]